MIVDREVFHALNTVKHYGKSAYGNLHVESRPWRPLYDQLMEGIQELGFEQTDLNGPQRSGFAPFEVTQKRGYRWGTFAAFLKPILNRDNIYISRYSHVTKIKLDKSNRATGVWYVRHGVKRFARATKEIIVSAGAIDSPKLLMLSGIGPKKHLKSVGIKTKVDLPVGKNLVDHVAAFVPNFVIDKPLTFNPERDFDVSTIVEYVVNGTGPFATPAICLYNGFVSTSVVSKKDGDWPDIQMYFLSSSAYSQQHKDLSYLFQLDSNYFKSILDPVQGLNTYTMGSVLVRPKSTGEIKLKDRNPFTPPIIDPHYLEHPDDVRSIQEGIQVALDLTEKTKAFKKLNARLSSEPLLGCENHKFRSSAYWECYIRHMGTTLYHPAGTCRMGKESGDPKAVLDSRLRVLNTRGLRVADASIMPEIVNGNTNAPSIMIGEKASDFIREYWAEQYLVCPNDQNNFLYGSNIDLKCYYSQIV